MTAVIFDVDGTLVDSVDLHAKAWQEAFAVFGRSIELLEIRRQIGKGGDQLMPVFLSKPEIASFGPRLEAARSKIFKEKFLPSVTAFPQVRELIQRLRADSIQVALASSAKKDELGIYKHIAGIDDLIEEEASSADAAQSKPQPDIFEAAMRKLANPPESTVIVVGDTPYDAEAALKAGLTPVGVRCGGWSDTELAAAGCARVFNDPTDLLSRYEELIILGGRSSASK